MSAAGQRYPSLTWPWVGLLLCLALLGQEYMLLAAGPNPPLTVYRLVLMAVGLTSLALVLLPPRRIAYLMAFAVCAGLIGYALYLQYVDGLDPCPLCVFQRIAVIGMGLVFLVAAWQNPGRTGAGAYALVQLVIGGAGVALAARQVWLQSLPKDQVPSCGMGLSYMLETLPFTDVLKKVLQGSGECAEKGWEFLHLSIAGWTLVFFIAMIVAAFALIRRD
ncbi:MAG TPA: disulfide bond formation protein B [Casimicrobiaceae bacterium]|nr:disulfide bond formation protein B [Casimicrobiaceae bacterium]